MTSTAVDLKVLAVLEAPLNVLKSWHWPVPSDGCADVIHNVKGAQQEGCSPRLPEAARQIPAVLTLLEGTP